MSAANNLASGLSGNRPDDGVDETVGFQLVQEEKPEEPKLEADEVLDETATCNKGGSESEESGDDDEALLARLQTSGMPTSKKETAAVKPERRRSGIPVIKPSGSSPRSSRPLSG